jgi:type IV fimbrial biogenesis protein FimT
MRPYEKGMSLIEIMIGLTLISIMLGLGVASLFGYNVNTSIRGVSEEMNLGLRQARIEAITRNSPVQFSANGSNWTISIPPIGLAPAVILAQRTGKNNENNILFQPANLNITFNGQGFPSPLANYVVTITAPSINDCVNAGGPIRCLQVQVSTGGRIRTCDPSLANTDPRAC